ncbi:hypothetical protein EDD22DRAFT_952189, partial [Suillus occidentalis]
YTHIQPSPPNLEQALDSGNDDHKNTDALSSKRKIRDKSDALHSPFQDVTNAQVASVPAIKSPPSKRRKLRKRSEIIEAGLIQSLAKVAEEVTAMREALGKIKEDLVGLPPTSALAAARVATIVVDEDAQINELEFIAVGFDPGTRCMNQVHHGRRQQFSRNVAVTGNLQVLHAPYVEPDEFRFYVNSQALLEFPEPQAPYCPLPASFTPPPPALQPRPSSTAVMPSIPLFSPPSPSLFPPSLPQSFSPPSPLLLPPSPPPLFLPSSPPPSPPPSPALSHQPASVETVARHDEELANLVAQLSRIEGLGPSVLTQLANLEWDLTHSEMWRSCVDLSELEKS